MTETDVKSDFLQPDKGHADVSLRLPYDRLRTPQTRFSFASLSTLELKRPHRDPNCPGLDDAANLLAACVALLYRYSGQSLVPVSVALGGVWPSTRYRTITVDVSGRTSLARLQSDIAAKLDNSDNDGPVGVIAAVVVSIATYECGSRPVPVSSDDDLHPDVHLTLSSNDDNLSIDLDYNESLFDRETASRFQGHLKTAIIAASADSDSFVADMPLLSQSENQWLENHCNGPAIQFPQQPVHVEFEACAASCPDKIAAKCNEQSVSYESLNHRANQIARFLANQGVGKGKRVVVCLDPSVDVVSTLLGILKAGATYVPANPGHPMFRVEAILEDTRPSLIITQTHLAKLFESVRTELLCIDQPPTSLVEQSVENPNIALSLTQIAYIYYTSGTTGKPKGVMASHANLISFIRASRDRYGITSSEVMPAVASYTFSISMFELMSPLSVGAELILLEREHVLDAERLAKTLQEVTLFHIGPSLLKNIVKYIKHSYSDFSEFLGVRHASSGGDMVPPELLCDMQEIFPQAEIYVIYGCSEISLMGCTWEVPGIAVTKTFVGRPFANVQLHVLDEDGNRLPAGTVGDVCFGGNGIVAGYLNRPELTDELFFEIDGRRCYRTGDRGRLNAQGHLELLGRRDFQIQLRGMRIELGEIDYHLRQADGVREGVVAAKDRGNEDKVLVAYFVQDKDPVDVDAIREHMIRRLPDYMVPAFYVELEALPLNHNLKVDRKALPDYAPSESLIENPPQTRTEIALAAIWCDLLRRDAVDIGENFMALGGDSLLAMQLIILVEQEFGCKLDGLEILREALAMHARIIDHATNRAVVADQPRKSIGTRIYPVSSFYFGRDESLYGLYHAALETSDSTAVLICPPIGYEHTLCQYLLHLLAENLAVAGVPSMRFDFFGMGDSCGRNIEATFERWREDLRAALEELVSRSGAKTVRILCFRLNTILAFHALKDSPVDRWVCWDPVTNGERHYQELQRMTRDKAQQLLVVRNLKAPRKIRDAEELVGVTFSRSAIDELTMMALDPRDIPDDADVVQVLSGDYAIKSKHEKLEQQVLGKFRSTRVDQVCGWYESTRLKSAITYKSMLDQLQIELAGIRR